MASISAIKCDKCGAFSDNPLFFRRIIGNVVVPNRGGLIGNNIINSDIHPAVERSRIQAKKTPFDQSKDFTLKIFMNDYCTKCFMEICGIDKNGTNTFKGE